MTESTAQYRPAARVSGRIIDGQLIILRPGTDELVQFNEVATFTWALIQEVPRTLSELAQAVADEFDVSESQAAKDLNEFLEKMINHNYIEAVAVS